MNYMAMSIEGCWNLGMIPNSVREPGMALVHGSHNMTEVPKKRAVCVPYACTAPGPRTMAVRGVNPVNCTAYISIMAELQVLVLPTFK